MKSLLWSLKAGVLVAAFLLLSGAHTFGVKAQDEGPESKMAARPVCLTSACGVPPTSVSV